MTVRKLGEFGTNAEAANYRLVTEHYEGNPRRYVRLQEHAHSWETIGYAELHPALGVDRQGRLADDGVVLEWSGYYSIRRHHQHRLTVEMVTDTTLVVRHEYGSTERHGGADDPGWTLQDGWLLTPNHVRDLDAGGESR